MLKFKKLLSMSLAIAMISTTAVMSFASDNSTTETNTVVTPDAAESRKIN